MKLSLSPQDRLRIRAESGCADETVKKYPRVSDASKRRIERASAVLGIVLPGASSSVSPAASEPSGAA